MTDIEASTLATILGAHLLEHYAGAHVEGTRTSTRLSWRAVSSVHDLIESDLAGPMTLDRLAQCAHLSLFHFARAFKATVGVAPHRYVTLRRIDRARLLLTAGSSPVATLARQVGFSNIHHFRQLFRHHTGQLPSQLRSPGSNLA